MENKYDKVLVYGSLKKNFGNHRILGDSKFIGEAHTLPVFTMISMGAFPACLIDGETSIKGEVYEVDQNVLKQLDWLEGHPNFYRRIQVSTSIAPCWMYVLSRPKVYGAGDRIESGVWEHAS